MRIRFIILCFLLPGFGYLRPGRMWYFYASVILLFSVIASGSVFRLFPSFAGFVAIVLLIFVLHFGTALHAVLTWRQVKGSRNRSGLKIMSTGILLLVTVTCFGNSAAILGFDRVSMGVPVMEPTIRTGEQLLVDTWFYSSKRPQKGDIIIHRFSGQKGMYLNRIIATPGDILEIRNGTLYINGESQVEDYVVPENAQRAESVELQSITVPSDRYFVMGDNRDRSFGDSRFSGMVKLQEIKGKVTCILYSAQTSRVGNDLEEAP